MGTNGCHLILFFSIDELARLQNEVGAELRSFFVRREKRSMEDAVDLPGRREVKAIGIRGYDLRDLKGAFLLRGQFLGGEVDLQLVRVKPDLRSYFPRGELHSNPFFNRLSCLGVSGRSLFASGI